jgi:hypothetical protein
MRFDCTGIHPRRLKPFALAGNGVPLAAESVPA